MRLTAAEHEVVTALAFLEGVSSAEVIRAAVSEFLAEQARDPDVVALQKVRAERRGKLDATIAPFKHKPRRSS